MPQLPPVKTLHRSRTNSRVTLVCEPLPQKMATGPAPLRSSGHHVCTLTQARLHTCSSLKHMAGHTCTLVPPHTSPSSHVHAPQNPCAHPTPRAPPHPRAPPLPTAEEAQLFPGGPLSFQSFHTLYPFLYHKISRRESEQIIFTPAL